MALSARVWDHMYRGTPSWELGGADPVLIAALDADRVTKGRAIDLGCGTGDNALELARRGFDVVGVDVSQKALEQARAKASAAGLSVEFIAADVATLPSSGDFDLVVDRGLLMSLAGERSRRRYVRRVEELCAADGRVYSAQWVLEDEARGWTPSLMSRTRVAVLRPKEMEERFGRGFAIEILHSESIDVDDEWLRRMGLRTVMNVSYWLQRKRPC